MSKIVFVENKDNQFGVNKIVIRGLKEGQYRLHFKKENEIIQINAHQGEIWKESDNFIITKKEMI